MFSSIIERLSPKYFFFLTGSACLVTLLAVYLSEYGFGLIPCPLCFYQRYPYIAALLLSLMGEYVITARHNKTWLGLTIAGCFFLSAAIALYHVSIEQGFMAVPSGCTENQFADSIEALRLQLEATPATRCDIPAFVFLGLSMAGWNVLWSGCLALFSAYYSLYQRRHSL